jgi:hypothetical protein
MFIAGQSTYALDGGLNDHKLINFKRIRVILYNLYSLTYTVDYAREYLENIAKNKSAEFNMF